MKSGRAELLVARNQVKSVIESLINVGHLIANDYYIADMLVRLDESRKKQCQRCNAHCAHRAL